MTLEEQAKFLFRNREAILSSRLHFLRSLRSIDHPEVVAIYESLDREIVEIEKVLAGMQKP